MSVKDIDERISISVILPLSGTDPLTSLQVPGIVDIVSHISCRNKSACSKILSSTKTLINTVLRLV